MPAIVQAMVGERRSEQAPADLQHQAAEHEAAAQAAAAAGDLETAAREILRALNCERRARSAGPQVLQLIKPRP